MYYLAADTEAEMHIWVTNLCKLCRLERTGENGEGEPTHTGMFHVLDHGLSICDNNICLSIGWKFWSYRYSVETNASAFYDTSAKQISGQLVSWPPWFEYLSNSI